MAAGQLVATLAAAGLRGRVGGSAAAEWAERGSEVAVKAWGGVVAMGQAAAGSVAGKETRVAAATGGVETAGASAATAVARAAERVVGWEAGMGAVAMAVVRVAARGAARAATREAAWAVVRAAARVAVAGEWEV